MPVVDRRFWFLYRDGEKLYPQLYSSQANPGQWVYHISPARNALGHVKEAMDLKQLKHHVLELGWRMRARAESGRNGSYARYAGGVTAHGEDPSISAPDTSNLRPRKHGRTTLSPEDAIGSRGGAKDGEIDANGKRRRSGQGRYKLAVIDLWQTCSVTGCANPHLLVASHIVAHKDAAKHEQLDPHNGLLLTPNLDRLFDRGLISFDENGKLLVARRLDPKTRELFGVHSSMRLRKIPEQTAKYLARHRKAFSERDSVRT